MNLNWNPLKQNVAIIGYAQTGKTNLAFYLIKKFLWGIFNVIIFDPHNRFTKLNPTCVIHNTIDINGSGLQILQSDDLSRELFKTFCKKVMQFNNLVVVIDELHNFVSKYRTETELDYLLRNCNNRFVGYMTISQRPQEIPTMVVTNARHRFSFAMDYPSDIKLMSDWFGMEFKEFSENNEENFKGIYKEWGAKGVQYFKVQKMT